MVLAGSYLVAMNFAGSYVEFINVSPVNPAIALTITIVNSTQVGWRSSWIYCGLGFAGSLLAFIFYTFVYVNTVQSIDKIEEEEAE